MTASPSFFKMTSCQEVIGGFGMRNSLVAGDVVLLYCQRLSFGCSLEPWYFKLP